MSSDAILVNRAPVLTLWAAIVAERMGYPRESALTLGRALAGLNAQSKGRRLGIFEKPAAPEHAPRPHPAHERADGVLLLGRTIPVVRTASGVRAAHEGQADDPAAVERYLRQKFGASLGAVEDAMREVADSYAPRQLAELGFSLYEEFRPEIPQGKRGWGARGTLDLDRLRALARHG